MMLSRKEIIPEVLLGLEVEHDTYGVGIINKVIPEAERIIVSFPVFGNKRFLYEALEDGFIRVNDNYYTKLCEYKKSLYVSMQKQDIQKTLNSLRKRGINYFVHFTSLSNLDSIMKLGLINRTELESNKEIMAEFNDNDRYDHHKDAISLSIQSYDYSLFMTYKYRFPNRKWAILYLNAEKVATLDAAYYPGNAAKNIFNRTTFESHKGYDNFKKMFKFSQGITLVDKQVEVMVRGTIPIDYLEKICFEDRESAHEYMTKYPCLSNKIQLI